MELWINLCLLHLLIPGFYLHLLLSQCSQELELLHHLLLHRLHLLHLRELLLDRLDL